MSASTQTAPSDTSCLLDINKGTTTRTGEGRGDPAVSRGFVRGAICALCSLFSLFFIYCYCSVLLHTRSKSSARVRTSCIDKKTTN